MPNVSIDKPNLWVWCYEKADFVGDSFLHFLLFAQKKTKQKKRAPTSKPSVKQRA